MEAFLLLPQYNQSIFDQLFREKLFTYVNKYNIKYNYLMIDLMLPTNFDDVTNILFDAYSQIIID